MLNHGHMMISKVIKMILYTKVNHGKKGGAESVNCHDLFTDKSCR